MNKNTVFKNVTNVYFGTSNIAMFNSSEISNHFKVMLMTTAPTRFQVSPLGDQPFSPLVISLRSMNFLCIGHTRSFHSVRMRKVQLRSAGGSLDTAGTCYVSIVVIFVIITYLNMSILPISESRRGNWIVLLITFNAIFWLVKKTNDILNNCTCVFCSVLPESKGKSSCHFLLQSSLSNPQQLEEVYEVPPHRFWCLELLAILHVLSNRTRTENGPETQSLYFAHLG